MITIRNDESIWPKHLPKIVTLKKLVLLTSEKIIYFSSEKNADQNWISPHPGNGKKIWHFFDTMKCIVKPKVFNTNF